MCSDFHRQANKRNRNLISCTVITVIKTLTTVYSIQCEYTKCATIGKSLKTYNKVWMGDFIMAVPKCKNMKL